MLLKVIAIGAVGWVVMFAGAAPADAAKVGEMCGGILGLTCDAGLWCDPAPGQCGGADVAGTCVQVGQFCPRIAAPVCGCNGRTYSNDCERQKRRVGKRHDGRC
jgi:hypothetical protein